MKNKKTLVLGATDRSDRYANIALNRLVDQGHSVIAIGQHQGEVAGVKIQTKKIPLTNTQNKSEEEVLEAVMFFWKEYKKQL